ncbi:MAG: hypothetical protein ACRDRK_18490 [Pseudonocardia sp.]
MKQNAQKKPSHEAGAGPGLVKYKYPPDKQPGAIKLVMEQMEQLTPRYAERAPHSNRPS